MKFHVTLCGRILAGTLFAACAIAPAASISAADAVTNDATTGALTSTKDKGVVSIVPAASLSGGRLVLKVVAFNRTKEPTIFGNRNISIFTAAGEPVAIVALDQLIAEAQSAAGADRRSINGAYQSSNYSRPSMPHSASGELDVTGHTGANESIAREVSSRAGTDERSGQTDEQLQQQIAGLKAGVLHAQTIAPASAAGGQIVTHELKFGRREERALRVVVDFNGERHEFAFAVPRED